MITTDATPKATARDAYVAQLRAANVAPDAAEREATKRFGPAVTVEQTARDARVLEKQEQHEVVKRFRVCGFDVYNLSQPRASKQTPGLPDLWLMHQTLPIALWWETKRQVSARFGQAQLTFGAAAIRCDVGYRSGDRYDAERHLIAIGRAWVSPSGIFEPTPTFTQSP